MLVMAQTRQLDMREVLKHPLGPLPWSLATADGIPRKTNNSALAKELRKNISPVEFIQPKSACLIDGMALVHKTKREYKTFGDIASLILSKAVNEASQSSRIDFVFDMNRENSIKVVEREGRQSNTGSTQLKNITVIQRKRFLSATSNKTTH